MRRIIHVIGIELLAIILAFLQWHVGVRTDEAKYLLNIPYPHPPGARFVLSLLKGWEFQEIFWRLVFATLLIQAVWLVWDLARDLSRNQRLIVSLSWLFSAAVLIQAGTVMMAPLTALQALVLLWLRSRPEIAHRHAPLVALFWLWMVFTAFQSVLFAPLAWVLFTKQPIWKRLLYSGLPLLFLGLYTAGNPLAAATILIHGGEQVGESIGARFLLTLRILAISGSVVLSIAGTLGVFRSKRWDVMLSFLLVTVYVLLSRFDYYAVLFTPLLVVGFSRFFDPDCKTAPWYEVPVWTLLLTAGCWGTLHFQSLPQQSVARSVMQSLDLGPSDLILIHDSFGHEWQYESPSVLRRFTPVLIPRAQAIICLHTCPPFSKAGWQRAAAEVETWVR